MIRRKYLILGLLVILFLVVPFAPQTGKVNIPFPIAQENKQYSVSGGTNIEDFIDGLSSLHAPSDIGTHSDWAKEQAKDSVYDTLTEANVPEQQTVGQTGVEGSVYNTVGADAFRGTVFTTPAVAGIVTDAHFYTMNAINTNAKVLICTHPGLTIITNGVSDAVTVSTVAEWKTATWTTPPTLAASTAYVIGIVAKANVRFGYYDSTNLDHTDASNSYTTPANPTDAIHSNFQSSIYVHYSSLNYRLDLEVGWTAADYSQTYEELCLYAGTQGAEALNVDVWNGAAWVNVIADIQAAQWNNISITTYLTSAALEMRFIDTSQTLDGTTADTYQIDAVLLHVWSLNVAPTNDAAASCLNPDDTDNLYARYRIYNFSCSVQDQDGYGDINYVELSAWGGALWPYSYWTVRYTQATNTITEEVGASYIAVLAVQYTKSTTNLDIWLNIKIEWAHPALSDKDLKQVVVDNSAASDTDLWDTNYEYIASLDFSSFGLDDGLLNATHGDYNTVGGITASGVITYVGFPSRYPPSNETDIWLSCTDVAGSPWSDLTVSSGGFSVAIDSDDIVGLDTYAFKAVSEGAGSAGTNLLHAIHSADYVADKMVITLSTNATWTVIGYYANVSYTAVYDYDDSPLLGTITWSNTPGVITKAAGAYSFYPSAIAETLYGLTTFSTNTVNCTWDDVVITSGPSYFWVQYSVDAVWLVWGVPSSYQWQINGTWLEQGTAISSHMNGTTNAKGAIWNSVGDFGGLVIGPFSVLWYYVNLTVNVETTVSGINYDWCIWSQILSVDIMHTIHLVSFSVIPGDVWLHFYFTTNWANATITIWDSLVSNTTPVGYSPNEGDCPIALPTTVGFHNFTLLCNGTHSGSGYADQVKNFAAGSSWFWINWKYTLNPIQLSFDGVTFTQNNESIIIVGRVWTSTTTLYWTVYEASLGYCTGTMSGVVSGSWISWMWGKSSVTSTSNFTVYLTDGSYNNTFRGFYLKIAGNQWISYGSSVTEDHRTYVMNSYYSSTEDLSFRFIVAVSGFAMLLVIIGGMAIWWHNRGEKDEENKRPIASYPVVAAGSGQQGSSQG